MSKVLCIYHGNCADGFTAAWAVRDALGDGVEFHPGVYGQKPPDVTGRRVILVDFSYKRPVLDDMAAEARWVLILDHHKTAAEDLARLPEAPDCYASWCDAMGDGELPTRAALFDMERSGAGIAWDFFHDTTRPLLVDYVEDRDLWRFRLPQSREVNAYIFAHEYDFKNWDYLSALVKDHMGAQLAADMGGAIEKKHHKDVAELVAASKRPMYIGGYVVPVANLPYTLTSDAGNLMARGEPFAACYMDTPDGRVFSLRSVEGGVDVSEIAKQYGGGGHKHAAGFRAERGWEGEPL